MENYQFGFLSVVPPLITVILALTTKEVFSSLILGIISGAFIYTIYSDGSLLIDPVLTSLKVMEDSFDFKIVLFCLLLGSLIYIIKIAGGSEAYGAWAIKRIKNRKKALFSTSFLGAFIFIDDYFNCMTVGTVMSPVTERYNISKAKLAYIIDSIASSVCILAPVSSWAAAVGSNLRDTRMFSSEMSGFISTIPWNFYAILCLFTVFLVCYFNFNFGPMKVEEERVAKESNIDLKDEISQNSKDEQNKHGTVLDMVTPIISLIVFTPIFMLYLGDYWGNDASFHSLSAAFGNTDSSLALILGSIVSLMIAFFQFVPRGLISLNKFMEGAVKGAQTMLPACLILTLAWTISGITRDLLHAPQFIASLVQNDIGMVGNILPAIIFAIAGFLSFATGSAWGTFGILIPIVLVVAQAIDPSSEIVVISLAATLSGAVFGDHCSPISDTTVLSAAGARCSHIVHVYTQLPYAILVATSTIVGFLVAGFTKNIWFSASAALMTLIISLTVIMFIGRGKLKKVGS